MTIKAKILTIVIVVAILAVGVGVGVNYTLTDTEGYWGDHVDLTANARVTKTSETVTVKFDAEQTFNTVVLKERDNNVEQFEMYYQDQEGNEVFFYRQDLIGPYRYCAFDSVTTDKLIVKITPMAGKSVKIKDVEVFDIHGSYDDDFRVTAYVVAPYVQKIESLHPEHFEVINHVNLITCTYFDEYGNLYFNDFTVDGVLKDGQEIFETALANVRAVAQPGTTIVCTILGQDLKGNRYPNEIHDPAFTTYKDNLLKNATAFCEKYDLDGLSFDYEYPTNPTEYKHLFDFCGALQEAMPPQKVVTVALCSWAIYKIGLFDHSGLDNVDWVEVMNYDETYEEHGYHSTFAESAYRGIREMENLNALTLNAPYSYTDISKINMGIPFYSRPIDTALFWGDYNAVAHSLGKFGNIYDAKVDDYGNPLVDVDGNEVKRLYYNGWQMVYDKTAFAIDHGVGGLMVWHYTCDVPPEDDLSLWMAMKAAIDARK